MVFLKGVTRVVLRLFFYKPVACNTGTARAGTREALGWDPGNCSAFLQAGGLQYWDNTDDSLGAEG